MKNVRILALFALVAPLFLFTCEREMDFQNSSEATPALSKKKCPPATFSVSPCDMRFRVFATYLGNPTPFSHSYVITNVGTGVVVDTGNVQHGQYTNSVLSHCTLYSIELDDPCTGLTTTLTAYSDGCGNLFLC